MKVLFGRSAAANIIRSGYPLAQKYSLVDENYYLRYNPHPNGEQWRLTISSKLFFKVKKDGGGVDGILKL